MRGRRGTFGTSIDVSGSLATKGDIFDAAAFCVAGVTLSAPQARFAWQAQYFSVPPGSLATKGDIFDAAAFCVAGVDTFSTSGSLCVAGVVLSVLPHLPVLPYTLIVREKKIIVLCETYWFLSLTYNDV